MVKAPSLISLAALAVKRELLLGDDVIPYVCELPADLFDILLTYLPPLALQKLQTKIKPFRDGDDCGSPDYCFENGRKHGRYGNFNTVWKKLFKTRWSGVTDQIEPVDWQQRYWEAHVQGCLDEAAELVVLPSFRGLISDINISDTILNYIGYEQQMNHLACDYSKLSYHCQQFGHYARCLRLQNALCVEETCVQALCKLLIQNSETLASLEFLHCKLSPSFVEGICRSLCSKRKRIHKIENLSIDISSFIENCPSSVVVELVSFLSSGRSLCSLKLRHCHLDRDFGRMVFSSLLEASSSLSILDLSGNSIGGWLSKYDRSGPLFSLGAGKSLQSLRLLNLRGNNLCKADARDLGSALVHIPNLEILDISDNTIEDDGIRSLIPYFVQASERCNPLVELYLENCELSGRGVSQLLDTLSTLRRPPTSLSIADNNLGSHIAASLGKFFGTSVQVLNIGAIGLGSSGFRSISVRLTFSWNWSSKNRGGVETAKFLSKLMSLAPDLVEVNAGYNLMPLESLTIICSALKVAKGHLQRLDLTGNNWELQPSHVSMLSEFRHNGLPILILPTLQALDVPYDDEP
ncbi:RNI-like superfamily protein [Citrus sinensis]|uniref:RNI-like superfamily protein n=1 Tax=Citrus sinensis TaxID=2711 RepID=A0ACB8MHX2_CITSI|nr:RNI-like superfamily protein [Citrus sinensis]